MSLPDGCQPSSLIESINHRLPYFTGSPFEGNSSKIFFRSDNLMVSFAWFGIIKIFMNYDVKYFYACVVASCRMGDNHSVHGTGAQYFHLFLLLLYVLCLLHQGKGEANGSETAPWSSDWCYCSGCCVSAIKQ